jgi:FkbM family methyltransferase
MGYRLRVAFTDVSAPLIYFGQYEQEESGLIAHLVRPGMTVLDIGANIGYFTLLMASLVGPRGQVHAIEPNPIMLQRVEANIVLNPPLQDGRIKTHHLALGAKSGHADFFCPNTGHEGVGGLKDIKRAPLDQVIQVPVATLDGFVQAQGIEKLDFIKMDIEGGELDVLRGGERALRQLRPVWLFEACELNTAPYGYRAPEILSYLEQRDYRVKQAGAGDNFIGEPKGDNARSL